VFYASTINHLADIGQITKGGETVTFAYAFFPWCFYWLLCYVAQVHK
jgi:hypothetical protein